MLKLTDSQIETLDAHSERGFALRVANFLDERAPGQRPVEAIDELIELARGVGLTWESTIAEYARLTLVRRSDAEAGDPMEWVGDDPRMADTRLRNAMRAEKT